MALLINGSGGVIEANSVARSFFEIDPARLPASLVEVTLEARLVEVLAASADARGCAACPSPANRALHA